MNEQLLFDFLRTNNIEYKLFKHQPVFRVGEEPVLIDSDVDTIPGAHSKNLFLKDPKNNSFFLVSVTQDKRVDLGALHKLLGCARFSFGKPEQLLELLKLTPGAVTPFGLMFDEQKKVTYILDEDFLAASFVNFHPLRNDMSISLAPQDFLASMEKLGHLPKIMHIPIQES
jgi:Ala-tRNA(Pro) deacylase